MSTLLSTSETLQRDIRKGTQDTNTITDRYLLGSLSESEQGTEIRETRSRKGSRGRTLKTTILRSPPYTAHSTLLIILTLLTGHLYIQPPPSNLKSPPDSSPLHQIPLPVKPHSLIPQQLQLSLSHNPIRTLLPLPKEPSKEPIRRDNPMTRHPRRIRIPLQRTANGPRRRFQGSGEKGVGCNSAWGDLHKEGVDFLGKTDRALAEFVGLAGLSREDDGICLSAHLLEWRRLRGGFGAFDDIGE